MTTTPATQVFSVTQVFKWLFLFLVASYMCAIVENHFYDAISEVDILVDQAQKSVLVSQTTEIF